MASSRQFPQGCGATPIETTSLSPTHPTPPPQQLRSMSHVCKCKERHHPQPTPPHHPSSCVACHMCASAKNVIIPNPPTPPPQQLRSMSHVYKCKERHHPQPTPPHHPSSCVACHMCASAKNVIIPNPPTPPPQQLRSMSHVYKCKERHHPQPTPPHHPSSCVACHMCASAKNVIIPNPPTPPPQQLRSMSHVYKCKERHHPQPTPPHHPSSCVACHMCASAKNVIIPNPPTPPPQQLRSMSHVYKCKERHHPQPTPPHHPSSCVACHMCASAKNVIIPNPPTPPPQQLRSMSHVYKCKERHHPQPTPPHHPSSCVACHMCASAKNVIIPNPPTPPPQQLRSMSHVCKCKERHHPQPTHPTSPAVA